MLHLQLKLKSSFLAYDSYIWTISKSIHIIKLHGQVCHHYLRIPSICLNPAILVDFYIGIWCHDDVRVLGCEDGKVAIEEVPCYQEGASWFCEFGNSERALVKGDVVTLVDDKGSLI